MNIESFLFLAHPRSHKPLSILIPAHLSICPSVYLPICLYVHLYTMHLPVYIPISLHIHLGPLWITSANHHLFSSLPAPSSRSTPTPSPSPPSEMLSASTARSVARCTVSPSLSRTTSPPRTTWRPVPAAGPSWATSYRATPLSSASCATLALCSSARLVSASGLICAATTTPRVTPAVVARSAAPTT